MRVVIKVSVDDGDAYCPSGAYTEMEVGGYSASASAIAPLVTPAALGPVVAQMVQDARVLYAEIKAKEKASDA